MLTIRSKMSRDENVSQTIDFKIGNILAIIILIVLVGLGTVYLAKYNSAQVPAPAVSNAQIISYDCAEGQTALAVLQDDNEVKTQDSDYGVYVDEINGTKNGDGSFWIYYVNGEMGQVGAEQYQCTNNDKIEWRFEEIM